MHRPHYIGGMPSVVHICNTRTLYINQSTSDQTPKYTLWAPNIPAKTNKSAKYAQHSSVWHVEYALKYGTNPFQQGTTCSNMLKTHYLHHWSVWHFKWSIHKYTKYGQNTFWHSKYTPNMALIVNSTETANMGRNVLYATPKYDQIWHQICAANGTHRKH